MREIGPTRPLALRLREGRTVQTREQERECREDGCAFAPRCVAREPIDRRWNIVQNTLHNEQVRFDVKLASEDNKA